MGKKNVEKKVRSSTTQNNANVIFDTLSDLCTMLVVGETEGFLLIPDAIPRLHEAMTQVENNGDLLVMGARALALLMENFRDTLRFMEKTEIQMAKWCLKKVSSFVTQDTGDVNGDGVVASGSEDGGNSVWHFSRLTPLDLMEEVLKCISLGLKNPLLERCLPPVRDQLRFCQEAAHGSLWLACKVLGHCMLLARADKLSSAADMQMLDHMLLDHLNALLTSQRIDYDWDELLRTVVFCIVTLRRTPVPAESNEPSTQNAKRKRNREEGRHKVTDQEEYDGTDTNVLTGAQGHRHTSSKQAKTKATVKSTIDSTRLRSSSSTIASSSLRDGNNWTDTSNASKVRHHDAATRFRPHLVKLMQMFITLGKSCAEARLNLLLSCMDTILETPMEQEMELEDGCHFLEVITQLHTVLRAQTQSTAGFSNPFTRRSASSTGANDVSERLREEEELQSLPNLQWVLPSTTWIALSLLAKLTGASAAMQSDYIWAYRGDGDHYFMYRPKHRALLHQKFLLGEREVKMPGHKHTVDLVHFCDRVTLFTQVVSPIHFQPVPFYQSFDGQPFSTSAKGEALARAVLHRYASRDALLEVLRLLSFGVSPAAALAKMAYLHVVCSSPAEDSEVFQAPFRELAARGATAELEKVAERLLQHDARWGPILLHAGVDEAIRTATNTVRTPPPLRLTATPPGGISPLKKAAAHPKEREREASGSRLVSPPPTPEALNRVSPVLEQLKLEQSKEISTTQSAIATLPAALPRSTNHIVRDVARGSLEALSEFADSCATGKISPEEVRRTVGEQRLKDHKAFIAIVETLVNRELQKITLDGEKHQLIPTVVQFPNASVHICREERSDAKGNTPSAVCPKSGHPLVIYHGVEWQCDECGGQTAYGSYACRECNYDVCYACLEKSLRCVPVNCTATIGDVLHNWKQLQSQKQSTLPQQQQEAQSKTEEHFRAAGSGQHEEAESDGLPVVHVQTGVLPMSAPAHLHANLHIRTTESNCLCSASYPSGMYYNEKLMVESSLIALLDSLGDRLFQHQGGLMLGVYGALEASGAAIALEGVSGVPTRMQEILVGARTIMPLAAKREISRFLSVDCRRFAYKSLTENQVLFPGTTHGGSGSGDAQSALIVTKAQVPRGSVAPLTDALFNLFTRYPGLMSKVEFSFTDEVGTGNGPTQEVYAELCRLYKENTILWYRRGDDEGKEGEEEEEEYTPSGEYFACPSRFKTFRKEFFVLGAACARGFADDYLVEMDLLPAVWGLVRAGAALAKPHAPSSSDQRMELLMSLLETLDETLYRSYQSILTASAEELESMCLESEDGEPLTTPSAAAAFVHHRVEEHFQHTMENIQYFMLGFSSCLDLNTFWFLTNAELCRLFGAGEDDDDDGDESEESSGRKKLFTEEEFRSMVEEAHGYEAGSPVVAQFISIVSHSFSRKEQRYFIEFLTGVPRLPVNGIRGLSRKITVVKKDMEGPKEETLPSCSTCFLYLKLPPYSSAEVMRKRLLVAVMEGRRNFSLS